MLSIETFIKDVQPSVPRGGDAYWWMMKNDPHIGTPDRDVLKALFRDIRKSAKNMCRENRLHRLRAYRDVIAHHRRNQQVYYAVMGGI